MLTAQKRQPRVHVSPINMIVAVAAASHRKKPWSEVLLPFRMGSNAVRRRSQQYCQKKMYSFMGQTDKAAHVSTRYQGKYQRSVT